MQFHLHYCDVNYAHSIYLCGCMKKVHWQVIKISWACKLTYLMYLHIKYLHMMCELQSEMWMQLKIHNLHCAYSWSSAMKFRKAIACLTRSCFTSVKPFFFFLYLLRIRRVGQIWKLIMTAFLSVNLSLWLSLNYNYGISKNFRPLKYLLKRINEHRKKDSLK